MEHQHPQEDHRKNHDIGNLDCLSICVLLAHGIDNERLQQIMEPMINSCCLHKLGNSTHLLQMAHSACHHQGAFARLVSDELDSAYSEIISRVDGMDIDQILDISLPEHESSSIREQTGWAWALLRSNDMQRNGIGNYLIHSIFDHLGNNTSAKRSDIRRIHLEHQCEGLQRKLRQKQHEIDGMLAYIHRTRHGRNVTIMAKTKTGSVIQ